MYSKTARWLVLLDFEIMVSDSVMLIRTNVQTPKKGTLLVAKEMQKLRGRWSSDSKIVDHFLEKYVLTKPATPENSAKENSVKFNRQR